MSTSFLTIGEVADRTGRSASTIRRLIRTVTDTPSHPDRDAIEPSPAEVTAFKKKGENFTWRMREDIVVKNFDPAPKKGKKTSSHPEGRLQASFAEAGSILNILQHELGLKNQQIEKQWEVIHALNDRLREGNILMGSLQKRLALPQAEPKDESIVEASITPSTEVVKKPSMKTLKKVPVVMGGSSKKEKKGLFGWW